MTNCPNCQSPIPDSAQFCPRCGATNPTFGQGAPQGGGLPPRDGFGGASSSHSGGTSESYPGGPSAGHTGGGSGSYSGGAGGGHAGGASGSFGGGSSGGYLGGAHTPPPHMGGHGGGHRGAPVPNHMVLSVIATIVTLCTCCIPIGAIALFFSFQVNSKQEAGDIAGATAASASAKKAAIITLSIGAVWFVISLVFGVLAQILAMAGAGGM